jgi:hypothetical protein
MVKAKNTVMENIKKDKKINLQKLYNILIGGIT